MTSFPSGSLDSRTQRNDLPSSSAPSGLAPVETSEAVDEESRQLAIARRELHFLAQHLRRERAQLLRHYDHLAWLHHQHREQEEHLQRARQQLEEERTTLQQQQQALAAIDVPALTAERAALDQARQELEQQRSALRESERQLEEEKQNLTWAQHAVQRSREELVKLREEILQTQAAAEQAASVTQAKLQAEIDALRRSLTERETEIDALRRSLTERAQECATATQKLAQEQARFEQRETELRGEIEQLRQQLEARPTVPSTPPAVAAAPLVEQLPVREGASLEEAPLSVEPASAPLLEEIEAVEPIFSAYLDELVAFRQRLQTDRQHLEEDLRAAQARPAAGEPVVLKNLTLEHTILEDGKRLLARLQEEVRSGLAELQTEETDQGHPQAQEKPATSSSPPPPPKKARGTFHGLRKWLGGGK